MQRQRSSNVLVTVLQNAVTVRFQRPRSASVEQRCAKLGSSSDKQS